MRKSILFFVLPLLTVICFTSCKKQVSPDQISNQEIVAKVNIWLEASKPENKPEHVANIKMLKSNLEFSQLRIEESSQNEQIIVIPINEKLKTEKSIDPNAVANLVLIVDASGKIRKGNIVLFFPKDRNVNRVPDNTFHAILNTAKPNANGVFRYLSVTGRTLHELEYREGRLKSFRKIQNLPLESANLATTGICVDWYWVYTEYDGWGNIIDQWEQYIGTTCQSENCSDPYAAMLCPIDGSSGGGLGSSEEYEEERLMWGKLTWTLGELDAEVGSGRIRETSRVKGRFFKRNPQNDCIDSYQGSNVFLENNSFGSASYGNTVHTGTLTSLTTIRLSSSGRATFPNNFYVDYSKNFDAQIGHFDWTY